jgi:hypothetical protein
MDDVCRILNARGLIRLRKEDLSELLDPTVQVPTLFDNNPLRHYDAIYYWED